MRKKRRKVLKSLTKKRTIPLSGKAKMSPKLPVKSAARKPLAFNPKGFETPEAKARFRKLVAESEAADKPALDAKGEPVPVIWPTD